MSEITQIRSSPAQTNCQIGYTRRVEVSLQDSLLIVELNNPYL